MSHFLGWGTGRRQGGRVCWGGVGGRLVGGGVFGVRGMEWVVKMVGGGGRACLTSRNFAQKSAT